MLSLCTVECTLNISLPNYSTKCYNNNCMLLTPDNVCNFSYVNSTPCSDNYNCLHAWNVSTFPLLSPPPPSPPPPHPPLYSPPPPLPPVASNVHTAEIVGGSVGGSLGFALLLLVCGLLYYCVSINTIDKPLVPEITGATFIPFKKIKYATKNFDNELRLGEGGYGIVYKGISSEGFEWAIKTAKEVNRFNMTTFKHELKNLTQIRHVNLVKLIGYCCTKRDDQILVFEYMSGGTLRKRLSTIDIMKVLTFQSRIRISLDIAEGLNYLHKFTETGMVHRDVKTDNVLLDSNDTAKVSDFGLSRAVIENNNSTNTLLNSKESHITHNAGTFGYLDPEFIRNNEYVVNTSTDVYAFGVVLFEIITGRPAVIKLGNDEWEPLVKLCKSCVINKKYIGLLDNKIYNGCKLTALIDIVNLAFDCCNDSKERRPTMDNVVERLKSINNDYLNLQSELVYGSETLSSTIFSNEEVPVSVSSDSGIKSNVLLSAYMHNAR